MGIKVDIDKCTGCGSCQPACPFGLIDIIDDKSTIKIEGCTLCGACRDACSFEAIRIERENRIPFQVIEFQVKIIIKPV